LRIIRTAFLLAALLVIGHPSDALARGSKRAKSRVKTQAQRKIKRHHISVQNVNSGEKVNNLNLIWENPKNRNEKRIRKAARARLSHMFRDRKTGRKPRLPDRLLWYLYVVSYHYDKPIRLISGLRSKARKTSRHSSGNASDFRIDGVKNKDLWAYCKSRFKKVGLGYYPNSKFVHMDVRDKSYYWIDDSGPGEPSKYRDGTAQPVKEWREQRDRDNRRAAKKKAAKNSRGRKLAKR
jgi:uncharacterized protein YcbK (DUF882 family)